MDTSLDIKQFRSEYDEKSLGMLSDILSTLYANPERSVLREYIANGIDAHKLAGTTRPVEVTLPSFRSATLVIQDFGEGLSVEDLQNTFFKYVASTKGEDDSQIGALGIGAKSAFALTKSWTITNVYQGKKYVVASVNDAYGAPMQTVLVDGEETDDPSGITVSIPINDRHLSHQWSSTLSGLVRWFPKGSVKLAEGSLDVAHWTDKFKRYGSVVLDTEVVHSRAYSRELQVLMCGIVYTVDSQTARTVSELCSKKITELIVEHEGRNDVETLNMKIDANTPAPMVETARRVSGHSDVLKSFLDTAMTNTVVVETGGIDFMPSRESVKGTHRTIDSLVDTVFSAIEMMSSEIMAARKKSPLERISLVKGITDVAKAGLPKVLTAVDIHDSHTAVQQSTQTVTLHSLIGGRERNRALVTHVPPSAPLYKRKVAERHLGVELYHVNGDPAVKGFGSIESLFKGNGNGMSPVMELDDYKQYISTILPRSTGSGAVTHVWYSLTYNPMTWRGEAQKRCDTFDDIVDTLADTDKPVYVLDDMGYNDHEGAAAKGLEGYVISRGRRQKETFSKELGVTVRNDVQLRRDAANAELARAVALLSNTSDVDLNNAITHHRVESTYIGSLEAVLDSSFGSVIPSDHRARKLVNDFSQGAVLEETDKRVYSAVSVVLSSISASKDHYSHTNADPGLITDRIKAMVSAVDPCPWSLIGRYMSTDSRTMQQAAVYLAAVG